VTQQREARLATCCLPVPLTPLSLAAAHPPFVTVCTDASRWPGELHDLREYGTWDTMYEEHTEQASWILLGALCWVLTHYLFWRPLGLYHDRGNPLVKRYNDLGLQPRFRFYFGDLDFRAYTNIHIGEGRAAII
jgi:hypothetical protein